MNIEKMRAGTVLREGAIQLMPGGCKGSKAKLTPEDMRDIPPFPGQASALAQEFGLSFATDNDYNGCGKRKVFASHFACPEVLEEEERVFGPDPLHSFIPDDELRAAGSETVVVEDVPFWKLFGLSDVVRNPNGPELIILTLARQPELIGTAYVMAEKEGAKEVLALLPRATEKAVKRLGAEAVISALDAEDCDGTGWGSLKRIQQFARGELYRQLIKKQERGYACGVLQALGFSLKDITKGRTRPTLSMA